MHDLNGLTIKCFDCKTCIEKDNLRWSKRWHITSISNAILLILYDSKLRQEDLVENFQVLCKLLTDQLGEKKDVFMVLRAYQITSTWTTRNDADLE